MLFMKQINWHTSTNFDAEHQQKMARSIYYLVETIVYTPNYNKYFVYESNHYGYQTVKGK